MSDTQTHTAIAHALQRVRERIDAAAWRAGRSTAEIALIAVSKTFPVAAVLQAAAAGQADFGENRVEEALPKVKAVEAAGAQLRWHLIGHLQSRKVRDAIGHFDLIHSVDSLKLAAAIDRRLAMLRAQSPISHPPSPLPDFQSILLECNVSGEESKSGFAVAGWESGGPAFDAFVQDVEKIVSLPHLRVRGLMTIAPIVTQPEQARPYFAGLRALRDALHRRFPQSGWEHLSMGMTDDFEAAIAEGATLLRIGRAIFGERSA